MVAARSLDLEQARRLEKGLVAVRWFAVAFALFQVSQDNAIHPIPPPATQPRGFVLVVVLALGNLVIWLLMRQAREFQGGAPSAPADAVVQARAQKRVALKIIPEKIASWDHSKLEPGVY